MKYNRYEIEWPNGNKELVKVPQFFQPSIVKTYLPYCELRLSIPQGFHVYVEDWPRDAGRIDGPCIVKVTDGGKLYYDSIGMTL